MLTQLLWQTSKKTCSLLAVLLVSYIALTLALIFMMNDAYHALMGESINSVHTSIILGLVSLQFLLNWGYDYLFVKLALKVAAKLRLSICQQVANKPYSELEAYDSAAIHSALSADILMIQSSYQLLPTLIYNLTLVAFCFSVMFYIAWPIALLIFSSFSLCAWIYLNLAKQGKMKLRQARRVQNKLNKHYEGIILGNKELKHNAQRGRDFIDTVIKGASEDHIAFSRQFSMRFGLGNNFIRRFLLLQILILLCVQPFFNMNHTQWIGYLLVNALVARAYYPILSTVQQFTQAKIAFQHLKAFGFEVTTTQLRKDVLPLVSVISEITFKDVCFQYQNQKEEKHKFGCGPFNFKLKPGTITFIVGNNGSGKSSLIKLISGLYQPTSGQVFLDNLVVNDGSMDRYRQSFACIYENDYLFETIMGHAHVDQAKVEYYLNKLGLKDKVALDGNSFSTLNLSKGQRKRLALLVAYLDDKPVYIFDEWAADQDPEFRAVFYGTFLKELKNKGKIVIAVSHDDRYFDVADRVMTLSNGVVVSDQLKAQHAAGLAPVA